MGSSGGSSTNRAMQAEAAKQSNIDRSVAAINAAYSSPRRNAEIDDFLSATRSFYRQNLDREKDVADRSLKFAMARRGLTGGSAAVDANRTLGENYQQGILNADRMAQGDAAALRDADENARMNMISMAQSGANVNSNIAQTLQASLAGARSKLNANALGDVFGGMANVYQSSRDAAAERRGNRDLYNLLYTPGFGQGGR